jgi:hypothetical protein
MMVAHQGKLHSFFNKYFFAEPAVARNYMLMGTNKANACLNSQCVILHLVYLVHRQ